MKTLIALITIACGTAIAFADTDLQKSAAYLRQGIVAEKAGDPDKALESYKAALLLNPKNADARYRAGQVKINAASIRSNATEAKIGAVKLPVYQIEDSSVSEAIQLLGIAIDKESEGEIAPNFVIEDPKGKLADIRISMELKNVPAKAVLDYIHSQANTKARFDEHAVVILAR